MLPDPNDLRAAPNSSTAAGQAPSVVAVVRDEATIQAFEQGLAFLGTKLSARTADIPACLAELAGTTPPEVFIVDIGDNTDPRGLLDRLVHLYPSGTRVVVIGDNHDIDFYQYLVRELGVAEYLAKPITAEKVRRFLPPLLKPHTETHADPTKGEIVAVFGLRGGAGAKSIATSLAYELKDATSSRVVLVDLNVQAGEMAPMLGVQPSGMLRSALRFGTSTDPAFVERAAIELEPRLSLIAPPIEWDSAATVDEHALERFLEALRKTYDRIVILVPSPLPSTMARVFTEARRVLAVLMPDAASLRIAQGIRGPVLAATGVERMVMVVNRFNVEGHIEEDVVTEKLGSVPIVFVPDLGGIMLEAMNLGVAAVRYAPAIRKYIAPLVRLLIEAAPRAGRGG